MYQVIWLFRNDDQCDKVGQKPATGAEDGYQPCKTDDSGINIKILGYSAADSRNLAFCL